jgi:hypothetical protein
MPTKIITKNSSVAAAVPTAAVLELGELAVNVTDKRLFTENASGTVVELGTNPSTLNVTGAATFSGEITGNGGIVVNGEGTFSNGVYLGGSAAANLLDDYEEGTFAITNAGDATGTLDAGYTSHYTKVGNLVTVTIAFNPTTNFTGNIVDGLPYVVNTPNLGSSFSYASNVLGDISNTATAGVASGLYRIYFFQNQTIGASLYPQASAGVYRVTFSYKTL